MTPHISAKKGDIAPIVLMPGDPLRAKVMAEKFLKNPRLVSSVRNMFMYTGTYNGVPVSICGSGMGQPSIGIYSYELFKFFDVEQIVRVGSAGSYLKDLGLYSVFLVTSAYSDNKSFNRLAAGINSNITMPSPELLDKIRMTAHREKVKIREGRVHSSDVFYNIRPLEETIAISQAECVEMESAALFAVATSLNKTAGCLLTISDNLVTHEVTSHEERQNAFSTMFHLALEALTQKR